MSQPAPTRGEPARFASTSTPEASVQASKRRYGARNSQLRRLGYENYRVYLSSPHWVKFRAAFRAADVPQACICGDDDVHLHHLTYERIGAELFSDVVPLCGSCHALVHVLEFRGDIGISLEGLTDEERAVENRAWLSKEAERLRTEAAARAKAERESVLAMSFAGRLTRAIGAAKRRKVDVSHNLHILKLGAERGAPSTTLTKRLRRIEADAYGWDDWL